MFCITFKFSLMRGRFTNAPAYFMNLINKVFMDELDKFVIVFMMTYSSTPKLLKSMNNTLELPLAMKHMGGGGRGASSPPPSSSL